MKLVPSTTNFRPGQPAEGTESPGEQKMFKALPRYNWSPEDLAAYGQWRRWVLIIYGSIAGVLLAIAVYSVAGSPAPGPDVIVTIAVPP
jgi:hypothetical protein